MKKLRLKNTDFSGPAKAEPSSKKAKTVLKLPFEKPQLDEMPSMEEDEGGDFGMNRLNMPTKLGGISKLASGTQDKLDMDMQEFEAQLAMATSGDHQQREDLVDELFSG